MSKNQYVDSFLKGIKNKEKNNLNSPNNEESILSAINLAYGDAKRTMTGIGDFDVSIKNTAFKNLANKFLEYFKNAAPDSEESALGEKYFDDFHEKLCKIWCDAFSNSSTIGTYGKAQKIVNMTFKYLYCCENVDENYFKYCHMPLDSFTLEWYKRITEKDDKSNKVNLPYDMKWSKLDKDLYIKITNKIREKLKQNLKLNDKNGNGISLPEEPLLAEFIIWPNIQLQMAVEDFYFAYNDIRNANKKRTFKEMTLDVKLKEIKKVLP